MAEKFAVFPTSFRFRFYTLTFSEVKDKFDSLYFRRSLKHLAHPFVAAAGLFLDITFMFECLDINSL